MKVIWNRGALLALVVLAFSLLVPADVAAQAAVKSRSYDDFRGMRTRNIFDPERRGPRVESSPSSATPSSRPDYFALTGTMVTEGKTLAFFTGSRTDFNKVLSVRDKISDYTVANIASSHVDLERDGKPLTLAVGKQLLMDGSGTISAHSGANASSTSPASSTTSSDTTPPPGVPADKAEILRRMMERRQQENSK